MKNQKWRRVLSWILTLTMLLSTFYGTDLPVRAEGEKTATVTDQFVGTGAELAKYVKDNGLSTYGNEEDIKDNWKLTENVRYVAFVFALSGLQAGDCYGVRIADAADGTHYDYFPGDASLTLADGKVGNTGFILIPIENDGVRGNSLLSDIGATEVPEKITVNSFAVNGMTAYAAYTAYGKSDEAWQTAPAVNYNITAQEVALWKPINTAVIKLVEDEFTYDKSEKTVEIESVKLDEVTLTSADYKIVVGSDKGTNAGTYTVSIDGIGNYGGRATADFVINPKSISEATVTLGFTEDNYDGTEKSNTVTVKLGEDTLTTDDYTVTGLTGTEPADYTVEVTGKGNYTGVAEDHKVWTINPGQMTVTGGTKNYTYDGDPHGVAEDEIKVLVDGVEYAVTGKKVFYKDGDGNYTSTTSPTVTHVGDGPKTVEYQVTADGFMPARGTATISVNKADQGAPAAPEATTDGVTPVSVTLKEVAGAEYCIEGQDWSDELVFTGLTPFTEYTFYQRLKGDNDHNPSPSVNRVIKTTKHKHDWVYTTSDNMIVATCQNSDKGHSGSDLVATLSFNAPEELTYNGNHKLVGYNDTDVTAIDLTTSMIAITYEKKNAEEVYQAFDGEPIAVGDYKAIVTVTIAANNVKVIEVKYSITKAAITIDKTDAKVNSPKPAAATITYNGQDQQLISIEGIVVPDNAKADGLKYLVSTEDVAPTSIEYYSSESSVTKRKDANTYYVWYVWEGQDNYDYSEPDCVVVEIKPAAYTITMNPITKTYGEDDPALTYNKEGSVMQGDEILILPERNDGEKVGKYTISANVEARPNSKNYDIKVVSADFTITARTVSVDGIVALDKVYDGTDTAEFDTNDANIYGVVSGDDLKVSANGVFLPNDTYSAESASDNKSVRIDKITFLGTASENYVLGTNNQKFATATISQRPIKITAKDQKVEVQAQNIQSGLEYCDIEGEPVDGQKITLTLKSSLSADSVVSTIGTISVNDVKIVKEDNETIDYTANYSISTEDGKVTVTKTRVTVKTAPSKKDLKYSGVEKELVNPGAVGDGENAVMVYRLEGETEFTENIPKAVNAGNYTIYYKAKALDGEHEDSEPVSFNEITIEKATMFVVASANTITYGDEVPSSVEISYTGVMNSDKANIDSIVGPVSFDFGGYEQSSSVGEYTITPVCKDEADNYLIGRKPATLTVVAKKVGITWDETEFTYDGEAHKPTASVNESDIVNDDDVEVIVVNVPAGENKNVGTYTASADSITSANYELPDERTVKYKIVSANATLETEPTAVEDLVYDGDSHALVNAGSGASATTTLKYAISTDNVSAPADDFADWSTAIPTAKNAGTYYVWYKVFAPENGNYNSTEADCVSVNIAQKSAKLKADDKTKTYGDPDPVLTAIPTDVIPADIGTLSYNVVREGAGDKAYEVVKKYTIRVEVGDNPNYDFETEDGKLTIIKKEITVDGIKAEDKVYDGTTSASLNYAQAVFADMIEGDSLTITATGAFENANIGNNKTVALSDYELGGASAGNYTLKTAGSQPEIAGVKITERPITVKAKDQSVRKNDTVTVSPEDVELLNDTSLADGQIIEDSIGFTTTGTAQVTNSGKINLTSITILDGTTDVTANYDITLNFGVLTVSAPIATCEAPTAKTDIVYDGSLQDLVNAGTSTTGTLMYSLSLTGGWDYAIPSAKDVGEYQVYYKVHGNGEYLDSEPEAVDGVSKIVSADLVVKAKDNTITYGDEPANNGVIITGFKGNDKESVLEGTLIYKYDYEQYQTVTGNYVITPDGYTAKNYNIDFQTGTLTVEPKEVVLNWGETTLIYTGEAQAPEVTISGLVNDDEVTVTVEGKRAELGNGVAKATGLSSPDYKLPTSLTVLQMPFTIIKATNPIIKAPTVSEGLIYNGTNQELVVAGEVYAGDLKYAFANGYEPSDGTNIHVDDWHTTIPVAKNAGEYYVWYKVDGDGVNVSSVEATPVSTNAITIERRDLTIKAWDQDITYGDAPAAYEVSYNGIQTGDTAVGIGLDVYSASCNYAISDGAGSFAISVNATIPVNNPNYNILTEDGELVVKPRTVVLNWGDTEFVYDGNPHVPEATVDNPVEGDTVTVTVTGEQTKVGDYTATATKVSDDNYVLPADNTVDFSITKAKPTITTHPTGYTNLVYSGVAQELVRAGVVDKSVLQYAVSANGINAPENGWSAAVPTATNAGTYYVWYRVYDVNGNYDNINAKCLDGVTIAKKDLTISAEDKSVQYGTPAENVKYTYTTDGFVNGEDYQDLEGKISFNCAYTPYGNTKNYVIKIGGCKSDNYDITWDPAMLTVVPKEVVLVWDNLSFVYDGEPHIPTVSADGLNQDILKITVERPANDSGIKAGTHLATATALMLVTDKGDVEAVNYVLPDDATVQFVIEKANISENKITEPTAKTGLVYTGAAQELFTAGSVSDNLGTFRYALAASENTAEADLTFGNNIPTGKDAGTYYVWYVVSANDAENYNGTEAKKFSVSIDAATVTVSYNANEGEGTMDSEEFEISCSADMVTVSTNSFTKEGYEFVSWNTAADGSGTGYAEGDTFAPETIEDITLYAQWKPITFSVSFNMNGHGEQIETVEVISGNAVEAPADPTADGFAFGGWFTEAECSTSYNFATPVTEDIELFAKWTEKFTVSFNMSGRGTQIPAQEVVSGDTASKPADPTSDGYVFIGWFTESELTNEYDFATPVSANITLFAKWTEKFTVSFNMSGHGTQIPSQEVVSGDKAVRPADPTDPEYTFEDWFTAADYASVYDFDKAVSENITVYAKWNVTVSLDSISINKAPDKTSYTEGEVFDTTGMEVVATYTDGSKKTVSGYTITPSANLTASDNKVTVSYTEDGITCTADVAIKVVAKDAADVVVEDEDYSAWNLYEDTTEHTYTVAGASSNVAVKNSNTKSAAYYDAVLSGNTITVTVKGDLKSAAKAANSVLEFATDDGVVEFTLPVEYKKPVLKLSAKKATIKDGAESVVRVTVLRKSASGVFEPMNLDGAEVTYGSQAVELEDEGVVAITVSGAVKNTKISVVGEGWNSADPVQLAFSVKASKKSVLTVEMGTAKNVILNANAKGQSFEFPVYINGEAADDVTVDDAGTGIANVEGGVLTVAYPEGKTVKAKTYTVKLSKDGAKASVKVKVSDKALSSAVKLTVKSKYDVVTGQKMVIVPNFKDLGGKLEDVNIEMNGFSAVVNEAGNIVVDYEGSAYNVKNLNIGTMTFKLSVEGVEDEIAVTINNVKAKKSSVKVKAAAVTMKAGAECVANLVCSYTDSAKNLHLVAPLSVTVVKAKNVTAVVSEEDPTVINLSGFSGKKGSVKVKATFPGGLEKTVTIKVKESK